MTAEVPEAAAPTEPERMHGARVTYSRGQRVLHPVRDELVTVVHALRQDGFNQLLDVTAVDYLTADAARELPDDVAPERFEVVVNLISHGRRDRVRLRVQVPADDPHVATLFDEYPGSEAFEREVNDMFGIVFVGHPDPTRILMPEDWIGYPLRKDYAIGKIPVQFKDAPSTR